MRDLPQQCITGLEGWIALRLAARKPLVESIHMLYVVYKVVDAADGGREKADPHLGCTVWEMGISESHHCHTGGHVRADGVFPFHRKATVDGLLAAFSIQRVIRHGAIIFQAAALNKVGDGLA